jgi:hypothetical protein
MISAKEEPVNPKIHGLFVYFISLLRRGNKMLFSK